MATISHTIKVYKIKHSQGYSHLQIDGCALIETAYAVAREHGAPTDADASRFSVSPFNGVVSHLVSWRS